MSEYWPLVCMEEGNRPGDMAISGGHGNAQEEYATRRRRTRSLRYTILRKHLLTKTCSVAAWSTARKICGKDRDYLYRIRCCSGKTA